MEKRVKGFYGYTITCFDKNERRARPSGNQKIVISKAFGIITEDSTVKSIIVWDTTGKVYRTWIKDTTGKIKRIK